MGAEGKFDGPHEHVVVNGSGDIEQSQGSNAADVSCLEAVKRRGTSFSSSFEMFIAVMGPGSLTLASALAALGWVAGLLLLGIFGGICYIYAHLLIMCHEQEDGKRHRTYYSAVQDILGPKHALVLIICQQVNIVLFALSFAITCGTSMSSIAKLLLPSGEDSVLTNPSIYILIFSALMLLVVQINSLAELSFLCVLGAVFVLLYDGILIYLGAANWSYYGSSGSMGGQDTAQVDKMWSVFNAFGLLLFTWSVAFVLVEIVDTIAHDPVRRGRKAFNISYAMVAVVLFGVAIATYGSVGDNAPSWFLDAFTSPEWLLILADVAIILSLIPGYNLYLLPFLVMVEQPLLRRFPRLHPRVLMLIWRSCVVVVLGIIGALLPFFTNIISLVGAIGFWPISVYFPLAMWIELFKPKLWIKIALQTLSIFCLLVTILAIVGSMQGIIANASTFTYAWS